MKGVELVAIEVGAAVLEVGLSVIGRNVIC